MSYPILLAFQNRSSLPPPGEPGELISFTPSSKRWSVVAKEYEGQTTIGPLGRLGSSLFTPTKNDGYLFEEDVKYNAPSVVSFDGSSFKTEAKYSDNVGSILSLERVNGELFFSVNTGSLYQLDDDGPIPFTSLVSYDPLNDVWSNEADNPDTTQIQDIIGFGSSVYSVSNGRLLEL